MKHLRLAKKNREVNPESWDKLYENKIIRGIRGKKNEGGMGISIDDEAAMFRKEIARLTKAIQALNPNYKASEEFENRNNEIELLKAETKEELEINRGVSHDGV